jgi:hypothetical protein
MSWPTKADRRYVFTWPGDEGPCVRNLDNEGALLAYACGWCDSGHSPSVVVVMDTDTNTMQVRA